MNITHEHIIILSPFLNIGLLLIIVLLFITWQRNHFINSILTTVGLCITLIIYFISINKLPIYNTTLFIIDYNSFLYTTLILITGIYTSIYAYEWLKGYKYNKEEFYLLLILTVIGGMILSLTNHLAILYIAIELNSLPLLGLIGYVYYQKNSLEASIKYMLLSGSTSAFLLFGIGLIYIQSGNLSFNKLYLYHNMIHDPIMIIGIGMILIGLCSKLSLVPFQLWTTDVYQGSPTPTLTYLITGSKIGVFAILMRLIQLFSSAIHYKPLLIVMNIIAIASILIGNIMAISQKNIKRLLGCSSISHMGYLIIPLIILPNNKIIQLIITIYLINYLITNLGILGIMNILSSPYNNKNNIDDINYYHGLYWKQPILTVLLTIMLLSLAGIPLTLGFIAKFYILLITINTKLWWMISIIFISQVISLYYYLRFILQLYNKKINSTYQQPLAKTNIAIICVVLCTIITILFGILPELLLKFILTLQTYILKN